MYGESEFVLSRCFHLFYEGGLIAFLEGITLNLSRVHIFFDVWRLLESSTSSDVLFHQDNAPAHSSAVVVAKLIALGFQLVPDPFYSPDVAPSDCYLYVNMKKRLTERRNKEVIAKMNAHFAELDKSYYSGGIKKLE